MTWTQLAMLSQAGSCRGRLGNEDGGCEDGWWKRSFSDWMKQGNIRGQAGRCSEPPSLVEGVPAHCGGLG